MKRLLIVFLMLLLLVGCSQEEIIPTEVPTDPTEPTIPWVEEVGMDWDTEGVLKEIPLTIPDGLHLTSIMNFDGDLLLWSIDDHLEQSSLEMVLVELDDGTITATLDLPVGQYVYPQCLGDTLYLCDGTTGLVTALDKNLETVQQWEIEPTDHGLNMGGNGILYASTTDEKLLAIDLSTGESYAALEGDPTIGWVSLVGGNMIVRCYTPDTGTPDYAAIDLMSGEYTYAGAPRNAGGATKVGDTWMYEYYGENYMYDFYTAGQEPCRIAPEFSTLNLLKEGKLLSTSMDSTVVSLYELDGSLISSCRVSEREMGYIDSHIIWNDVHNGYFVTLRNYGDTARLLFWDVSKSIEGEDLAFEPVPTPEESQLRLETRAAELGKKYGVNILVGEQCDTQFDEFSATLATDYEQINQALNVLDRALAVYPEGFLRQLRYGTSYGINIQLIRDLQADGSGRTGGGYAAFTQPQWECSLMVIDIEESTERTYYHEFSHIIDRCLEWDAEHREGALYSEITWSELNPGWFDGYTYDYSWERDVWDYGAFIDGYATIKPTEDRARVMEYAMVNWGDNYFEPGTVLTKKLDYYSRCIRDAFDTEGWPAVTVWEQYLK